MPAFREDVPQALGVGDVVADYVGLAHGVGCLHTSSNNLPPTRSMETPYLFVQVALGHAIREIRDGL